jgi:hypothetical protein
MKWIGIICLAISMSVIYPIIDWKSALVMIAFWFGLNFFVYGVIDESKR